MGFGIFSCDKLLWIRLVRYGFIKRDKKGLYGSKRVLYLRAQNVCYRVEKYFSKKVSKGFVGIKKH